MKKALAWLAASASALLRDMVGIVGVLLVAAGAGMAYRPLAFIVLGTFMVFAAWLLGKGAD